MNWDDLRVCLAVARNDSLSGAARVLGLDPATVGRRIGRLEAALGTVLFLRSPQGYVATAYGERILARAEQAELALRHLRDESDPGEQLSGLVRIGAPDGVANYLLPQVCAEITRANPELEIQIVALPRVFNLSKREADMAIAVSAPDAGRLTVQKITDYRLHLVASIAYLQGRPPIHSLDDLQGHPVVGYIADMIFDKELDYLGQLGLGRTTLASNSVAVQVQMLRQGAGIGVAHDFALPFAPELTRVLADETALTRSFYLIRHADDRRNDRLSRLARLLTSGVRHEVLRLEAAT